MQVINCEVHLDDGQIISGQLKDLDRFQLISLANQFYRNKQQAAGQEIMAYQHRKFGAPSCTPSPSTPTAA